MKGSFRLFCAAAAAVVFLAGCAHPQLIDMGESSAVVAQELGEPMAKTPMPDGTERWTYSMQPFGQEVWWLFMDKTGGVSRGCRKNIFRSSKSANPPKPMSGNFGDGARRSTSFTW